MTTMKKLALKMATAMMILWTMFGTGSAFAADTYGNTKFKDLGKAVYGQNFDPNAQANSLPYRIGQVIQVALGLLGVIFVVLMVYAGYLWMTARGEADQVDNAKDTIRRALIGFIIITAAYAITSYVMARLLLNVPAS
jgi:cytochrome bd-type quinol oxidase subunit 2